jgi:hypothetical protein
MTRGISPGLSYPWPPVRGERDSPLAAFAVGAVFAAVAVAVGGAPLRPQPMERHDAEPELMVRDACPDPV